LLSLPRSYGGRRPYIWTWDTETMNAGEFEVEQWLWSKEFSGDTNSIGWLWFAPIYGLTNNIELAFPWEIVTSPSSIYNAGTKLTNFTVEARIRLYDPLKKPDFVNYAVRLFYQQNFDHPVNGSEVDAPWIGGNLIISFGDINGSHATVDIGGYTDLNFSTKDYSIQTLGLGYTHLLTETLRFSGEYFHEISVGTYKKDLKHYFLGPTMAYSRGNVWLNFGVLFGLTDDSAQMMPRLIISAAL